MFLESQPSDSNQSGVYVLVVGLYLPSSTLVGVLVSVQQLKDMHQAVVIFIPSGGTRCPVILLS